MSVWGDRLLCFLCGREKMHAGIRPWLANFRLAMAEGFANPALIASSYALSRDVFRAPENRTEDWFAANWSRAVCGSGGNPGSNYLSVANINGSACCRKAITLGSGAVTGSGRGGGVPNSIEPASARGATPELPFFAEAPRPPGVASPAASIPGR